jgi:hypothetical protein
MIHLFYTLSIIFIVLHLKNIFQPELRISKVRTERLKILNPDIPEQRNEILKHVSFFLLNVIYLIWGMIGFFTSSVKMPYIILLSLSIAVSIITTFSNSSKPIRSIVRMDGIISLSIIAYVLYLYFLN